MEKLGYSAVLMGSRQMEEMVADRKVVADSQLLNAEKRMRMRMN
jgi:hypothetical protein